MNDNTQADIRPSGNRPKVVIIGGGFAGLNLIQKLDKKKFDITLVDQNNFHSFPPLFYQVASGGLDPGSISFPLRREMRMSKAKGVHFHMGAVRQIDYQKHQIITTDGSLPYDHLIIAAGTTNNFFGNNSLKSKVYTLKSTGEAIMCRDEVLSRLEQASNCADREERRRLMNFMVVGGGPTGVEIAGALGEMKRYVLPREYPELDPKDMNITLIEGSDRVLGTMAHICSEKALKYLGDLMVNVELGKLLKDYDGKVMTLNDGSSREVGMLIWTAGVKAIDFDSPGDAPQRGPGNRIIVDDRNRVPGFEGVYAVGDIAIHVSDEYPKGCPQLAQVAIQQATLLASQLNSGEFTRAFCYRDKGSMATVGRNRAVVDLKKWKFGGWFAWLTWMFVHLITLLGMRNKITVLINWTWAYFTYSSSLRLIFHLPDRK